MSAVSDVPFWRVLDPMERISETLFGLIMAIPFIFLSDAKFALRVSYAVAIVMLFCCGSAFGYHSGLRPWAAGLSMVAVGGALVSVAVALGG
jgi:VIT1/CCC1 family predicted Fe2+/Mn2+ transporter